MANSSSRLFKIKVGGTVVASVRQKSVTWNGTPIDVSSDDDAGATTYLADEFADTTLEISVSGLTDGDVLSDAALATGHAAKHLSNLTVERANGDEISGNFILTNYAETGEYKDAVAFTATLVRNALHTWTPAV